jgi:hypothetical protein
LALFCDLGRALSRYWLSFGTGAAALAVALSADRLGRLLGVIDRPDSIRKTHLRDTPLVGVPAVLAFVLPGWTIIWALLALTSYAVFLLTKLSSSPSQHQTVP